MREYVVGDIHGCLNELEYLIGALPLKSEDQLVFLGDYVDRGPDSKGVISYLIELRSKAKFELVLLKGNHEDMLLSYIGVQGNHGDVFLVNGGSATLASYGVSEKGAGGDLFRSKIPLDHLDFFKGLKSYHIMDSYLCVHAGINPVKPLGEQNDDEMLWIRHDFISAGHSLPYTVLFGHTSFDSVLFDLPFKVGLDTGLVYGNTLSCLEVSEKLLFQIKRGSKQVSQLAVKSHWGPKESTRPG